VRDVKHFGKYVRQNLEDNLSGRRWTGQPDRDFLQKILFLLDQLVCTPGSASRYQAFHLAVFVKARVLQKNQPDVSTSSFGWVDELLHAAIETCLQRHCCGGCPAFEPRGLFPVYYNCAAARRELWNAMTLVTPCIQTDPQWDSEEYYAGCHHRRNLPTLEYIQKHARGEIRSNVLLAVGKHLPAELAELVIEATFEAEGLPLDWEVTKGDEETPSTIRVCDATIGTTDPEMRSVKIAKENLRAKTKAKAEAKVKVRVTKRVGVFATTWSSVFNWWLISLIPLILPHQPPRFSLILLAFVTHVLPVTVILNFQPASTHATFAAEPIKVKHPF